MYSRWQADAADVLKQAANNRARAARVAIGEVLPEEPGFLKDTLSIPDFAALDASIERTRLLMANGVDALALALDAAHTAGASTSLEKMHLHQLAVLHKTALEQISAAKYAADPDRQVKHFQTANRLIRTFQQGPHRLGPFAWRGTDGCPTYSSKRRGTGSGEWCAERE